MAFRDIEEKSKWKPPVGVYCRCHVDMEETKEEGVKEIKYPGPEEYGKNNCGTGILIKCSTCEKDTNDFYRISFDSMFPVLTPQEVWWLCPACYEEHVVEPARKETKEGKAEEVMYPGPERYESIGGCQCFTCDTYVCESCYHIAEKPCDYAKPTRWLCPSCYEKHVVGPTKEEKVKEIKYPGAEQYVRIRSVSTTYTCRTCKRVGDAIWSARAMCNHEATQICHACYHEHVVGPAKEEKVKKEIEYPSKERYERMEHDEASECLTCHINTKVFYTVSNLGYKMNLPCKVRWLCVACYEEHVVKSELAPMKKVEPPKPAVKYPTSDCYEMIEHNGPCGFCHTCELVTNKLHVMLPNMIDGEQTISYEALFLCPECFIKHAPKPIPIKVEYEMYDVNCGLSYSEWKEFPTK